MSLDRSLNILFNKLVNEDIVVRDNVTEKLLCFDQLILCAEIKKIIFDCDHKLRIALTDLLGNIKIEYSAELLQILLNDKDSDVKITAIKSIRKLNDPRFGNQLLPLLSRFNIETNEVRELAADTLATFGDNRAIPLIWHFYGIISDNDKLKNKRQFAKNLLGSLLKFPNINNYNKTFKEFLNFSGSDDINQYIKANPKRAVPQLRILLTKSELLDRIGLIADKFILNEIIDGLVSNITNTYIQKAISVSENQNAINKMIEYWCDDGAINYEVLFLLSPKEPRLIEKLIKIYFLSGHPDPNLLENYLNSLISVSTLSKEEVYWIMRIHSDEAIENICKINTSVSSNILNLVLQKQDITETVYTDDVDNPHIPYSYEKLTSFKQQRDKAADELRKRGNPVYDSNYYLK